MKSYRIAAIPGDGIGQEVIAAGVEVLQALAARDGSFGLAFDHFDWGSDYYKRHGLMMPENGRDLIRDHDAIFFGAVGMPDVPDHITLCGACASRSASPSTNTPMCARPGSCPGSRARCGASRVRSSIG
jgi:isocitrate/isopropylmalate dehydrogenase